VKNRTHIFFEKNDEAETIGKKHYDVSLRIKSQTEGVFRFFQPTFSILF